MIDSISPSYFGPCEPSNWPLLNSRLLIYNAPSTNTQNPTSGNEPVPSSKSIRVNPAPTLPKKDSCENDAKTPCMTGCIVLNKTAWPVYWFRQVGGAKPPIPPLSPEQARAAIDQQLQAVAAQQPTPTRWCLRRMLAACSGIVAVRTLRGLLGILPVRRRGRLKITR